MHNLLTDLHNFISDTSNTFSSAQDFNKSVVRKRLSDTENSTTPTSNSSY